MTQTNFWHRAVSILDYRQRAYKAVFNESGPLFQVMVDLAKFSAAFDADAENVSRDKLLVMHGRRQLFFRIVHHLKLSPQELEQVYRPALVAAATRLQSQKQGTDE